MPGKTRTEKRPPKGQLNIRQIDHGILHNFGVYCAKRGYSKRRAVIALLQRAYREDLQLTAAGKRHKRVQRETNIDGDA